MPTIVIYSKAWYNKSIKNKEGKTMNYSFEIEHIFLTL